MTMKLLLLWLICVVSVLHNDARSLTAKQIRALRILEEMFDDEQGKRLCSNTSSGPRFVCQIPHCTHLCGISTEFISFHQTQKTRFAKEFFAPWNLVVFNTMEKISIKIDNIIRQALFFHFDVLKTIPWKFWMDGYNLEFEARTFGVKGN